MGGSNTKPEVKNPAQSRRSEYQTNPYYQHRVHPVNSSQPQTSQFGVDPISSSQLQYSQNAQFRADPTSPSHLQNSQNAQLRADPINSSQSQAPQLRVHPVSSSQPQTSQLRVDPISSSQLQYSQNAQFRADPTSSCHLQNSQNVQLRADPTSSSQLSQINFPSRAEPMNNCDHFEQENKLCRDCNKHHFSLDACDKFIKPLLDERWVYIRKPEIGCPLGHLKACSWKGENRSELPNHLSNAHPNNIKFKLQTENVQRNILTRECDVQVLLYENQTFLFHLSINHLWACMTIQLIGPEFVANEWVYRINLFVKRYKNKKMVFAERCSTNEEAVENVFTSGKGLIIPIKVIKNYLVNGDLTFSISLHKYVKPTKKDSTKTN